MTVELNRFKGSLLGLAIGDSLGAPFEFLSHRSVANLSIDDIFEGALKVNNGVLRYTDDTLMAIHLAEAIVSRGEFDPRIVAESYYRWFLSGDLRGIGSTTRRALERYSRLRDWRKSGVIDVFAAGNCCAMRVAPIALYAYNMSLRELYEYVRSDCIITHYNEEAVTGALAVAIAIREAIKGKKRETVVDNVIAILEKLGLKNIIFANLVKAKQLVETEETNTTIAVKELGNTGYAAHSVPIAMWAYATAKTFEETVQKAVNAGVDADTHAAIAGAIKGAELGVKYIPDKYTQILENREHIENLAEKLYQLALKNKE